MKCLAFDIEISNVFDLRPGEDINRHAPFDVAVAATEVAGGEHRLWFSPGPDDRPQLNLQREHANELLTYLEQMQRDGYAVCAWNGLAFDLRWIGRAAGDDATASRIARAMFDPLFQFFKLKGFPIGLEAVAKGIGIGMRKTMDAADAPREWRAGNHKRVCEYVLGDVRLTNEIVSAIVRGREIAWITQRGKRSSVPLPRLRTVEDCMCDPMPDQSWMDTPIRQERFTDWLIDARDRQSDPQETGVANIEVMNMKQHRSANSRTRLRELLARDHTLHGGVLVGIEGHVIELQARAMEVLREPVPFSSAIRISGMARGAIGESIDRIAGSFAKFEIPNPEVSITINLAPADLPKEGTWLDLPLAIIALQAAGMLPDLSETIESEFILMGELGLHGEIRRVPGVLSIAYIAKAGQKLIVPRGNEKEAALILAKPGHEGCKVLPVQSLDEVIGFFRKERALDNALKSGIAFKDFVSPAPDFARVRGQEKARQAAKICAAGGHNLLLIGPPGEGKTLIANALSGILPPLTREEAVELTRIYSASGELMEDGYAVTRRPVRTVHHSASKQALVGGGSRLPRPGEATLAHFGVLFLDELAEFSQSTLDTLRQPLEAGEVTISRVGASVRFPCRFTLVAAMNPCPCGYFGTEMCRCDTRAVKKYQSKVSGPILDRIDLQVPVERLSTEERFGEAEVQTTREMREEVCEARARQHGRFGGTGIPFNAAIPGGSIGKYCRFDDDAFADYKEIVDRNRVSTRSMDRLAKVALTVADLDGAQSIGLPHVQQAAEFVVGGILREGF